MHTIRHFALTTLALSLGCVTPSPTPDHRVDPTAPIRVDVSGDPAPWLRPGSERSALDQGLGDVSPIALGAATSLWKTPEGVFAVSADEGVTGRLLLPDDTRWVGLGADDVVFAATGDGTLHRARSVSEATDRGAFARVASVAGAGWWDATATHVVAITPTEVFVSTDSGATFATHTVTDGAWMRAVFARPDGVLVALVDERDGRRVHVSRDDGASWERSGFHPGALRRDGSWVWNGDPNCPAIMSADPMRWSSNPSLRDLPGRKDPRAQMLRITSVPVAPTYTRVATPSAPGAPEIRDGREHVGLEATCEDPIMASDDVVMGDSSDEGPGREPKRPSCEGAQCLRGASGRGAPASSVTVSLLSDASCEDASCARIARAPHMLMREPSADRIGVLALPEACDPIRLFDAGGLAILTCQRGEEASIHTRSPTRGWALEASFEGARAEDWTSHTVAPDGTLTLHGRCPDEPLAACAPTMMRAPREAGYEEAWSAIALDGLVHARAIPGGASLAVTAGSQQSTEATIWYVGSTGAPRALATLEGIETPLRGIEVDAQGTLVLRTGDALAPARYHVSRQGELVLP